VGDDDTGRTTSGLEHLQAVVRGDLPHAPIDALLGLRLVEVESGRAVFHGSPVEAHGNLAGSIHGGYAALLLDSAMGCAALTTVDAHQHCATVAIELKLVSPMTAGMGNLVAEARAEHRGRHQVTATGRLVRERDGGLVAHGMTTCLVIGGARPAGAD